MKKPAESILRRDEGQSGRNRLLQRFARAGTDPSQTGFQFGECLFNGREIGRIGRQEEEAAASGFNGGSHPRPLVNREIIQNHQLTRLQAGGQKLLHIDLKS